MTYPIWPDTLPCPSRLEYTLQYTDGRLKKAGEGTPGYRRRFSRMPKLASVSLFMTRPQYQIFETFYETTLSGGSTLFWFPDPIQDAEPVLDEGDSPVLGGDGLPLYASVKTLCMFGDQLPVIEPISLRMKVSFQLVRMPV